MAKWRYGQRALVKAYQSFRGLAKDDLYGESPSKLASARLLEPWQALAKVLCPSLHLAPPLYLLLEDGHIENQYTNVDINIIYNGNEHDGYQHHYID